MSASSKLEIIIASKADVGGFSTAEKSLGQLESRGQSAARGLSTLGTAATVAGGVLAAGLAGAVTAAANFESRMSAVKAASGATGSELAGLSAKALEFGAATDLAGIDANDAATAMEQLAKGGVGVSQMAEAAHGALLLASAGEISVAEAADTAVRAMNIFGLSGENVGHVADVISAGANKSATDVGQLNAAFNQSASVAKGAGLSLEQLTGTLALLAQNGLQGSDAGTSLRTAIQRLTAPTDEASKAMDALGIRVFDANGKIRDFADIADNLKSALSGLSDEQRSAALQTIFGADAIRVANVLYKEGGAAVRTWTAAVNDSGSAARLGAERNNNLRGAVDQLKASLQTAAIVAGQALLPQIRALTVDITGLVDRFTALSPHTQRLAVDAVLGAAGVLLLGGAIIKTTGYIGSLTTAIQSVIGAFAKKEAAKTALIGANTALQGSMGATGVAATGLGAKLATMATALSGLAVLAAAGLAIKITFDLITEGKSDTATGIGQTIWRGIAGALRAEAEHSPVGTNAGRKLATDLANAIDASMAQYDFEKTLGGLAAKGALAGAGVVGVAGPAPAAATGMGQLATGANAANAAMDGTPAAASATAAALANMGVAAFTGALGGAAAGVYNLATALGVLSGQQGALSGQMGILQSRIDVLQEKQKEGIPLTQAEADELVTLQVAQQRLADQSGILAAEERAHVLAMAGLNNQFGETTAGADALTDATGRLGQAAGTGAVQAGLLAQGINFAASDAADAALKVDAYAGRIRDIPPAAETEITADTAAGLQNIDTYDGALNAIPKTVTTTATTPGLAAAQAGMFFLTSAINDVPKSFTVTPTVNLGPALSALASFDAQLPHSPAKEGPFRILPNWDALFEALPAAAEKYGSDAVNKLADAIAKVSGAIKTGVDALGAIGGGFGAGAGGTSAFLGALGDLMEKFTTLAGGWEEDVLKAASDFADTASKAVGVVKGGVDAFKSLADFAAPAETAVSTFLKSLADFMEKFTTVAGGWEKDVLDQATLFADGTAKSVGIIKGAVDGLEALRLFVAPAQSAVSDFLASLSDLMEKFGTWAGGFEADGLAASATFAEAAGKVTGAVKSALDLFKDLKDAGGFEHIQGAMKALDDAVYAALPFIERIGFNLAVVAQDLAPKWSDDTGKVIGLVKSVSDLFKDLVKGAGDFVHIPAAMKLLDDAFYASLKYMEEMAFNAAAWELAANTFQVNVSMGVAELKTAFARLQEVPTSFPALPGIPSAGVPISAGGGGGGHTNTTTVNNFNVNAPVYGVDQMEDVVVTAWTSAQSRGRL